MKVENTPVSAVCCCFFCLCVVVFICVALPYSFATLQQGQYALICSWTTQHIDPEVQVDPGVKTVGLGNTLIIYPSTYQTMYFVSDRTGVPCSAPSDDSLGDNGCQEVIRDAVDARSADGLGMSVSVSLQWRLQPQALHKLYSLVGYKLYHNLFVRLARAAIVEGAARFTAESFFTNRTAIAQELYETLSANFDRPADGLEVEIAAVQLREVDLPQAFNDEISNTQEQLQDVDVATAERDAQKITMETQVLVASEGVLQTVQDALGQAESVRLNNEAYVANIMNFNIRQATANALILQTFENDTEPFQRLFEVMQVRALQDHSNNKLLVNL